MNILQKNACRCLFVATVVISIGMIANPARADFDEEVEKVNTMSDTIAGIVSTMTDTDKEQINLCVIEHFKSKFPFDFVATVPEIQGDASCPLLSIFNNEYEACFITEIYDRIEPAILIALFWTAIISL